MLNARGFTVYRRPPADRRAWRLFVLGSLGLAACTVSVVDSVFDSANAVDQRFYGQKPRAQNRPVDQHLSDLGYPVQFRPDERSKTGIPVKAGNVWDRRPLGECRDHVGVIRLWKDLKPMRVYPGDLPPGDIYRWLWLVREGAAGRRSIEFAKERGRSASQHWDIHRGLLAGFTINAVGFTEYTQSPAGTAFYVSASGSNLNSGLSPASPLQTANAAVLLMSNLADDWILFRSGDAFVDDGTGFSSQAGLANVGSFGGHQSQSADTPIRLDRYGTGTRPSFDIKGKDQWIQCRIGTRRVHIGSLDIFSSTNDGHGNASQGITLSDNFTDGQVENCYIHDLAYGITVTAGSGHADRVTFRRNIIQNNFYIDNPEIGVGMLLQGFTEGLLLEENVLDHNGWHPTRAGAVKAVTRHNLYVTDTNQGYTCRRNISTRASNHGLGRCHGKNYHNVIQDCPTAILFAEDVTHFSGISDEIYQNSIIGRSVVDAAADLAAGISVWQGIEARTTETLLDIYDNTVSGYTADGSGMTVYGMSLSTVNTVGGILKCRSNCLYNIHNTSNVPTAVIRLFVGTYTHQLTINRFSSIGQMVWLFDSPANPAYVLTATGNQYFSTAGVANSFYIDSVGYRTYAQWVTASGETGSSFVDPAFSDPARDLAAYNGAVLGGINTLAAAVTRIQAYDLDTWTDAEHGVYPRLNYIRAGFGLAAVTDPYSGSGPPPPPPEGGDANPVLPGEWPLPDPASGGDSYWGADGEWHDIAAAVIAATDTTPDPVIAEILNQINGAVVPLLEAVLVELRVTSSLVVQAGNLNEDLERLRQDSQAPVLDLGVAALTELSTLNTLLARLGNVPDIVVARAPNLTPVGPKTADYTLSFWELARFDTTVSALNARLPAATGPIGTEVGIKNIGAAGHAVTIVPNGSDTCDAASVSDSVATTLMIVAPGKWEAF